jgi:hypothetical protein
MAFPVSSSPFGTGAATPTTPYTGVFIPAVWSGKLVEKFYKATVLGAIANTDYEGEIKNFGDKVEIRSRPTITIRDYEADTDLTVDRPSVGKQTMNIDLGKYFNLALDDVMELQADIDMLSIWAEDAAEQMKIVIDSRVLNGVVAGDGSGLANNTDVDATNRGATAGVLSANIDLGTSLLPQFIAPATAGTGDGQLVANAQAVVDYIINCGQVLDEQNIPESGRFLVIPSWMASMIKKSDLKDASLSGDGTSILRNGRLGMIDRFTIYISNVVLDDDTTAGSFPVFFGTKAGLSFASQFTKLETIRSERSFANLLRGLQVFGFKVVNGVALGYGYVAR